jgi:PilZ domain-containing protein
MEATTERRKNTRHALSCCVSFFLKSAYPIAEAVTRNLSSGGFYCLSPVPLAVGESLTCLLRMPSPYPRRNQALTLECMVRVVRLECIRDDGSFGIGCQMEGYRSCSLREPVDKVCAA